MEIGDCLYVDDDDDGTQAEAEEEEEEEEEEEDDDDDGGEEGCEYEEGDEACWGYYGRRDGVRRFPPPIPTCHLPTILTRTYEEGGRLVIREVKVQHHEFFRAHRENGRLTLNLVHMHQSDDDDPSTNEEEEGEEGEGLEVERGHCDDKDLIASTDHLPPLPMSFSSPTLPFPPLFEAEEDNDDRNWGGIEKNRCGNDKKKRMKPAESNDVRSWAIDQYSMLSSTSLPELTESGGGGGIGVGHGCFRNGRSSSLIRLRTPLMHLVQS